MTSGWRSARHQRRLFDRAVAQYGSREAASRWVLPPDDSAHVRGQAVDVGPAEGMAWLEERGAAYGLCRRYANEPWHFEPLTEPGGTCPALEPYSVPSGGPG
ncbi:D-alanyl-D-alanine carboxypeptidase family protein [Motilibacter aurantiacus]|uniref:D-alanyl-D-alanine carboxypeptidase family protein n=1 Tax=Motilibacter aurantiacus TaxID=2714955 RepID=UPI0022ABC39A|nr:D-alanyl-D-alanine carboxypeptidase family protein [Motilibacter aurantiacus]